MSLDPIRALISLCVTSWREGVTGVTEVPGVAGVTEVPGVAAVTEVPGVAAVTEVPGVAGVTGVVLLSMRVSSL